MHPPKIWPLGSGNSPCKFVYFTIKRMLQWFAPRTGEKDKCNTQFKMLSKLENGRIVSTDKDYDCFGRLVLSWGILYAARSGVSGVCDRISGISWSISKIPRPSCRTHQGDSNGSGYSSNGPTENVVALHTLIEERYVTSPGLISTKSSLRGYILFCWSLEWQPCSLKSSWCALQDGLYNFEIDQEISEIRTQTPGTSVYVRFTPKKSGAPEIGRFADVCPGASCKEPKF